MRIITFGEIFLRLAASGYRYTKLFQRVCMEITVAERQM